MKTLQKTAWLTGVALLVMAANIAASVLYMVVYGHLIAPGHPPQHYQDHIQSAGPICSIVAGIPLMFAAGYWVAGWWHRSPGLRAAWTVWGIYAALDLAILLASGMSLTIAGWFVASFATKLMAAVCGARMRLRPGQDLAAESPTTTSS
ncbi:MAG: hypothetical protein JSS02_11475 [Planctomycetes bacterium]|nr:hypothetical protein [Planctomycetota bacterium]